MEYIFFLLTFYIIKNCLPAPFCKVGYRVTLKLNQFWKFPISRN